VTAYCLNFYLMYSNDSGRETQVPRGSTADSDWVWRW